MIFADGWYSFRFGGYAMSRAIPHHVVGIGRMRLATDAATGKQAVTGDHVSAISRLAGSDAAFDNNRYTMVGTLAEIGGYGVAQIRFSEDSTTMDPQVLDARFHLLPAGDGRIWLISTSTRSVSSGNAPADEVISGEAVRISD